MADVGIPEDFEAIQRLLDNRDLDHAREILTEADDKDDVYTVLRLRLALLDGSVTPNVTLQKLIQLMRREPHCPGAKDLYQEASRLAYAEHQSSASLSHIPPPVRSKT